MVIPLTQGLSVEIDDADEVLVSGYVWCVLRDVRGKAFANGYLRGKADGGKRVFMHRLIVGAQRRDELVKFVDGNSMNCRRSNLLLIPPKTHCDKCGSERVERVSAETGRKYRYCLVCHARKQIGYYKQNADKLRIDQRDRALRRKYGLTLEDKARMVKERNGLCDMCGRLPESGRRKEDRVLHIDHDHKTGVVRGLLCSPCNKGLGFYEKLKDSAEKYLSKVKQ